MQKYLLLSLFSTLFLAARFSATPAMECEAYNNMKHTKNSHLVTLHNGQTYTVLKKHKGQFLVLIPGESIAQRWVDDRCFSKNNKPHKKPIKSKHTKKYEKHIFANRKPDGRALLALSWQNAFCQTHRRVSECKTYDRSDKGHLSLHGLWPQPRNKQYCDIPQKLIAKDKHHQWKALPNIDITEDTLALMDSYMPGYVSRLHKHEWIKHGVCYGTNAETYYHNALTLAKEVDSSEVGALFRSHVGKKLTLKQIRSSFEHAFGKGAGSSLSMACQGGLITEIRVETAGKGDKLKALIVRNGKSRSRCHSGKVDRTGY